METKTNKLIFTGTVESQGDFQIVLDNGDVTFDDMVASIRTIELSRNSINNLHCDIQTLQEKLNNAASKSQICQATLEHYLNMEKVDDPFEHFIAITNSYTMLVVCLEKFQEVLKGEIGQSLQNVDPYYEDMSKDIDWVQENFEIIFAQFGAKLLQETGIKIEGTKRNSVSDMLEDIRGEFDQLKEECKEMYSEMVALCEKESVGCFASFDLYKAKISDALDKDLACIVAQSNELSKICESYHVQAKDVISKELLDSDGVKKKFTDGINSYLSGYKKAYEMQRNEAIITKEALQKMAKIIKDPDALISRYDSKGRKIRKEKKGLNDSEKANLEKIKDTEKQIDGGMNTARINYKSDFNEVKTRADAIAISFQEKQ